MKISVELTLTPLQDDYEPLVKDFIKLLRKSEFKIIENPLSTHVFGNYYDVMGFLNKTIHDTFIKSENVIMNMKIFKTDRSNYKPTF